MQVGVQRRDWVVHLPFSLGFLSYELGRVYNYLFIDSFTRISGLTASLVVNKCAAPLCFAFAF